jgi:hypothetical protein
MQLTNIHLKGKLFNEATSKMNFVFLYRDHSEWLIDVLLPQGMVYFEKDE